MSSINKNNGPIDMDFEDTPIDSNTNNIGTNDTSNTNNKGFNSYSDENIARDTYGYHEKPLAPISKTLSSPKESHDQPESSTNPIPTTNISITDQPTDPISDHEYENLQGAKFMTLFTVLPISLFHAQHEFQDHIKQHFKKITKNDVNTTVSNPKEIANTVFFKITFNNEKTYLDNVNSTTKFRNKIFTFSELNTENYIKARDEYLEIARNNTIFIYDIPLQISDDIIIQHFETEFGKIHSWSDINNNRPNNKYQANHQARFSKPFRQMAITFLDSTASNKIFVNDNIWSTQILGYIIRILPTDKNSSIFKTRSSYGYRITGLPVNTTANDLKPFITNKLGGLTCTIMPNRTFGTTVAFVQTTPQHYDCNKFTSFKIFGTKIYVTGSTYNQTNNHCRACGNPTHITPNCKSITKANNRKGYMLPYSYIERPTNTSKINRNLRLPTKRTFDPNDNVDHSEEISKLNANINHNKTLDIICNNKNTKYRITPKKVKLPNAQPAPIIKPSSNPTPSINGTINSLSSSKASNNKKKNKKNKAKQNANEIVHNNYNNGTNNIDNTSKNQYTFSDSNERNTLLKENSKLRSENLELKKTIENMQKEIIAIQNSINNNVPSATPNNPTFMEYLDNKFNNLTANILPQLLEEQISSQINTSIKEMIKLETTAAINNLLNDSDSPNADINVSSPVKRKYKSKKIKVHNSSPSKNSDSTSTTPYNFTPADIPITPFAQYSVSETSKADLGQEADISEYDHDEQSSQTENNGLLSSAMSWIHNTRSKGVPQEGFCKISY